MIGGRLFTDESVDVRDRVRQERDGPAIGLEVVGDVGELFWVSSRVRERRDRISGHRWRQ